MEWARKSHQDPAVRFVTAKSGPERATKIRQYDLLRPRVGQKEPPRPGSTICYSQEWAKQIVLPGLGGSSWPSLGRNKSHCRVLVALSGPLGRNKSYCRVLVAFSGRWLFLVLSSGFGPVWAVTSHIASGSTLGRNKSYCRVLAQPGPKQIVLPLGPLSAVTNRTAGSWWLFLAHSCP